MRRYPFERARPQPMRSETVYIDRDSVDEPAVKPMDYPGSPPELNPLSSSHPATPVMAPISYRESSEQPSISRTPISPLSFSRLEAPAMAPVSQLERKTIDPVDVLQPSKPEPAQPLTPLSPSRPETPSMTPLEPQISPIAPPMPQAERSAVKAPEAPPELKIEPKQPERLTDEQLAAIFANVRQAPRVSLLSMPVSTKLFSEEYADAERL